MSVSVLVEFDRDDGVYRAGEPITGRVRVDTDRGQDCLGVSLTRGWRVHGIGTTDWNQGPAVYTIHEGPLPGGPVHRIPFEIPAPTQALTYNGGLFEVQHFVEVEVGLPPSKVSMSEALDASTSAVFTVLPGPLMDPPPTSMLQASAVVVAAGNHSAAGQAAISGATSAEDLQKISSILDSWPNLRRWVAERRVGPIEAYFSSRVVSPGELLKVKLRFEPQVPIILNTASIRIRAQEISSSGLKRGPSGMGEGREVRKNTLCSLVRGFTGPRRLEPGMFTYLHAEVEIPQTDAFTVISDHHQVVWDATVKVDIPAWPDWERAFAVVMWPEVTKDQPERIPKPIQEEDSGQSSKEIPEEVLEKVSSLFPTATQEAEETAPEEWLSWDEAREFAEEEGILGGEGEAQEIQSEEGVGGERTKVESLEALEAGIRSLWDSKRRVENASPTGGEPRNDEPSPPAFEPQVVAASPADGEPKVETTGSPVGEPPIVKEVRRIRAEKIIGGNRDGLIKALKGREVHFDLTVRKIERTMGMYSDPDYRNGRTVRGEIAGTDFGISVSYPTSSNHEIDSLEPESTYPIQGSVWAWDTLRREPKIRATRPPSSPSQARVRPLESDPTDPA